MPEKIVGHKTLRNADGSSKHVPLYESEANEMWAKIEAADNRRAELMPDEESAIKMLCDAFTRLKELGWNNACYCPKDGSTFLAIEPGSTGQHACRYTGEWPKGFYEILANGDVWPSQPVLFKVDDKCAQEVHPQQDN